MAGEQRLMDTPVKRFLIIAHLEGISFLVLLIIGMPLKYWAGMPEVVKYAGWIHGILFILYLGMLLDIRITKKWPLKKIFWALVASVMPFGPFIFEKKMMKKKAKGVHPITGKDT